MCTGARALAWHTCPRWHGGAHPCGGRAGDPLLAGFRSQPHFTTASCPSQRLPRAGARRSPVLGAGGPGEAWMDPCSLLGAKRQPLPARPGAAEMGGALRAACRGKRGPSACLPQPGSPGSAPTHRSLPSPPPPGCCRCLRPPPPRSHFIAAERALSRHISSPDEGDPQQPRWPFPRLTPNAFQLPGAQNQHRCFRHNVA